MPPITIHTDISAPLHQVWACWNTPEHVMQWNAAHESWHCPASTIDLRPGGEFHTTMAARDGSTSFDFWGTYDVVEEPNRVNSTMGDGRKLSVLFEATEEGTHVTETFDPETVNPVERQREGWQSILDNFKKYVESL
jgi:uncharacterized protein YndB with AHSA1/START domain